MTAEIVAEFGKQFAGGPRIEARLRRPIDGSVSVLFGPSGAGKTTVLRCLAGLERPDEGTICCGDQVWFDARRDICLPPQQRGIGYLPQHYALFPHLTVERNIAYALHGRARSEQLRRVGELVELLRLQGLEARYPQSLSGGQQQRVALARSLARPPRLLLFDEPLSALDSPTRDQLRGELRRVLAELRLPSVVVTHDRTEAMLLGDTVLVLDAGQVVQSGPVHQVFHQPATAAAARIAGIDTIEPGRVVDVADGLATVEVAGARLKALAALDGREVYVGIRAEDVILEAGPVPGSSARNRLAARVVQVRVEGPMTRVWLDCGFRLQALITTQASRELGLQDGTTVVALVKAPAVHLMPRPD